MQSYEIVSMIRDVRNLLDEQGVNFADIIDQDEDATELDSNIRSRICEAVRIIHSVAPLHLVDGKPLNGEIVFNDDLSGYVELPSDYLRLVSMRMSDWRKSVSETILDTDKEYLKQSDGYARGTSENPVCALVKGANGLKLEFYSCISRDAEMTAYYIPVPSISNEVIEEIEICEKIYQAVCYEAAALTMQSYGATEISQALDATAKNLMI